MANINFKTLFPKAYKNKPNCFIEVPDEDVEAYVESMTKEVADIYYEFRRDEATYNRIRRRYGDVYSFDSEEWVKQQGGNLSVDPINELFSKTGKKQLYAALANLPKKQARRIYAHYILEVDKKDIANAESLTKRAINHSILKGLQKMADYLNEFL